MFQRNSLKDKPAIARIFIFLGLVFLSWSIITFISTAMIVPLFGIDLFDMPDIITKLGDAVYTPVLKFIQAAQAIGLFIVPVLLYRRIVDHEVFNMKGASRSEMYVWATIVMLVAAPLIAWLSLMNKEIDLPEAFAGLERWMKNSEQQAAELTEAFLNVSSVEGMLMNIFIIALLPAIGEEFLFRGVLNSLFTDLLKNKHIAIFLTAILFSAFHLQFYGFIPRMLMGALLGYMMLWSGTIWVPVIAHFVNNGTAVFMNYLYKTGKTTVNVEDERIFPVYLILISLLMTTFAVYRLYKNRVSVPERYGEGLG